MVALANDLFIQEFLNIKQDSRLRGNDGISCFQAAFEGWIKARPSR
ncbi:hypothetical protein [Kingella sp. (in: b-proteobacteria)]|nr:hypothetical protein [Kingella sp. (in: b-proteobacteria)]MDO4658374.1 hypothetical protein [Kingella sp. (in: b-proteobacteria)]